MSAPAQLLPVIRLLPVIKTKLWGSMVMIALAKKNGHKKCLEGELLQGMFLRANIFGSDQEKLLGGIAFLVTQASRPGLTEQKLQDRLLPLGFDATKTKILWGIINTSLEISDTAADSDWLAQKAFGMCEQMLGTHYDSDEDSDEDFEWDLENNDDADEIDTLEEDASGDEATEDDDEDDEDNEDDEDDEDDEDEDRASQDDAAVEEEVVEPTGPPPLPELTAFVSKLEIPVLKRILRGCIKHLAGISLTSKELDVIAQLPDEQVLYTAHLQPVLKHVCSVIQAGSAASSSSDYIQRTHPFMDSDREELFMMAMEWFIENKQEADSSRDEEAEKIIAENAKMQEKLTKPDSVEQSTFDDLLDEHDIELPPEEQIDDRLMPVVMIAWERDLRGDFVAYRFGVQLDSGMIEFMIRYSDAAHKHKQLLKAGAFVDAMGVFDDSRKKIAPPFPPKHPLKDMINNDTNVNERASALQLYFSRIFWAQRVRDHPSWAAIFGASSHDRSEDRFAETTAKVKPTSNFVKLELEPGRWSEKWLLVSETTMRIRDSDDLDITSAFELTIPMAACAVKPEPRNKRNDAPYAFRIDVTDLTSVRGPAISKLVIDPETMEFKKRLLAIFQAVIEASANFEGELRLEVGAQNLKLRGYERRYLVIKDGCVTLFHTKNHGELCSIPGHALTLREPKKKRKDAPHAFRIDITDQSVLRGSIPMQKMVFDAADADCKTKWLANLMKVTQAGLLSKYMTDIDNMEDNWLSAQILDTVVTQHSASVDVERAPHVTTIAPVVEKWKRISPNERIHVEPNGCIVECTFSADGPLGIVFEGTDGTDVHVAQISSKAQAAKMTQLKPGCQLTHVCTAGRGMEPQTVEKFDEIDDVIDLVLKTARPVVLRFFRWARCDTVFHDLEPTGLDFRETYSGDRLTEKHVIQIMNIQTDTEAWDQPQLRVGLCLSAIVTYDGEEIDVSTGKYAFSEIMRLVDNPQRPLRMFFYDSEFDVQDMSTDSKDVEEEPCPEEPSDTLLPQQPRNYTAGQVLASCQRFQLRELQVSSNSTNEWESRQVTLRSSICGVAIFENVNSGGDLLRDFFPCDSIISARVGSAEAGGAWATETKTVVLEARPRFVTSNGKKLKRLQRVYSLTDGLDEVEDLLSSIENHKLTLTTDTAYQCTDQLVLDFYGSNPGCRVAPIKEGQMEVADARAAAAKKSLFGGKKKAKLTWHWRFASLNENMLALFEIEVGKEKDVYGDSKQTRAAVLKETILLDQIETVRADEVEGRKYGTGIVLNGPLIGSRYIAAPTEQDAKCWLALLHELVGSD